MPSISAETWRSSNDRFPVTASGIRLLSWFFLIGFSDRVFLTGDALLAISWQCFAGNALPEVDSGWWLPLSVLDGNG